MVRLHLLLFLFGTASACVKIRGTCCTKIVPVDQLVVPRLDIPGLTYKKPVITSSDDCSTTTMDCTGTTSEVYNLVFTYENGTVISAYSSESPVYNKPDVTTICNSDFRQTSLLAVCEYGCTRTTCDYKPCVCPPITVKTLEPSEHSINDVQSFDYGDSCSNVALKCKGPEPGNFSKITSASVLITSKSLFFAGVGFGEHLMEINDLENLVINPGLTCGQQFWDGNGNATVEAVCSVTFETNCCTRLNAVQLASNYRYDNSEITYAEPVISPSEDCSSVVIDCSAKTSDVYNLIITLENGTLMNYYSSKSPTFNSQDYQLSCNQGYLNQTVSLSCEYGCTQETCVYKPCNCPPIIIMNGASSEHAINEISSINYGDSCTNVSITCKGPEPGTFSKITDAILIARERNIMYPDAYLAEMLLSVDLKTLVIYPGFTCDSSNYNTHWYSRLEASCSVKFETNCCTKLNKTRYHANYRFDNNSAITYEMPVITPSEDCSTVVVDCSAKTSDVYNLIVSLEDGTFLNYYSSKSPVFKSQDFYLSCSEGYLNQTVFLSCEYGCTQQTCDYKPCSCPPVQADKKETTADIVGIVNSLMYGDNCDSLAVTCAGPDDGQIVTIGGDFSFSFINADRFQEIQNYVLHGLDNNLTMQLLGDLRCDGHSWKYGDYSTDDPRVGCTVNYTVDCCARITPTDTAPNTRADNPSLIYIEPSMNRPESCDSFELDCTLPGMEGVSVNLVVSDANGDILDWYTSNTPVFNSLMLGGLTCSNGYNNAAVKVTCEYGCTEATCPRTCACGTIPEFKLEEKTGYFFNASLTQTQEPLDYSFSSSCVAYYVKCQNSALYYTILNSDGEPMGSNGQEYNIASSAQCDEASKLWKVDENALSAYAGSSFLYGSCIANHLA